jgi:F0F1-type ATP synthase assembly protein I
VEALAEKADVKAQARQRADELKQTALQKKDALIGKAKQASPESASAGAQQVKAKAQENPLPLAVAGALLVGFLLGRRGR